MTPQEQQMLGGLIDRVRNTRLEDKDPEAEQLIQSGLGPTPDALYILAQTVLVQQYALSQAQAQLAQLKAENDQLRQQTASPQKHSSFLGSLLGRDDEPQHPAAPPPPPPPVGSAPAYSPVPSYPGVAPGSMPPQPGYGYGTPSGGGFLRSALQTATGVAAGALAFQGIEDLMHGFGHAAGYGSGFGGGGFAPVAGAAPREEVINNYYGDAGPGGAIGSEHSGSFLPDLHQGGTSGGAGADIWNSAPSDSSSNGAGTIWNTTDATQNDLAATDTGTDDSASFDNLDDTSASGDDSSGFGGDTGGLDDSGSFGDDSGGFDDSGSGDGF